MPQHQTKACAAGDDHLCPTLGLINLRDGQGGSLPFWRACACHGRVSEGSPTEEETRRIINTWLQDKFAVPQGPQRSQQLRSVGLEGVTLAIWLSDMSRIPPGG